MVTASLKLHALILIGLVLLPFSVTQGGEIYAGILGDQPVVMEIDKSDDGRVVGRYFYTHHHRDLRLTGTNNGPNHLRLAEGPDDADSQHAQIELAKRADGNWSGSWRAPNGKTLRVALQPARAATLTAGADHYLRVLRDKDLYEFLRLDGLTLHQGRRQKFMGYNVQWWVEPDSKITLFEILDGYPEEQRHRINQVLRDRLWAEVSSFHVCMMNGDRFGAGGDFEQTVTPRLFTANVVSVSVFTSYDCGGAHPDFADNPINLDVHTAQALTLEDVLWVGQSAAFHYADNRTVEGIPLGDKQPDSVSFDVFSDYRDKHLSPWLVKQLTVLYPSHIKDDHCDYGESEVWRFPSWYLTAKGIFFSPSFARAARVCEANADWSVVPYAVVNKHPGRLHLALP